MSSKVYRYLQTLLLTLTPLLLALVLIIASVTGCASLVPNYVAPELEHMSHATQHAPFTDHPTHYGANLVNVVVGYDLPHHFNLELSEGISLNRHCGPCGQWGEIAGPREQFSARLRYMIQVRK